MVFCPYFLKLNLVKKFCKIKSSFLFRADKEALENNLFDAQTTAATLEAKKEQLEEANQNSMMKNEALQGIALTKTLIFSGVSDSI